jgi:hypothetical protein
MEKTRKQSTESHISKIDTPNQRVSSFLENNIFGLLFSCEAWTISFLAFKDTRIDWVAENVEELDRKKNKNHFQIWK